MILPLASNCGQTGKVNYQDGCQDTSQILCLFLQSIVQPQATGEHRIHLKFFQQLIKTTPLETTPLIDFIDEYLLFQNALDKLTYWPRDSESHACLRDDRQAETSRNRDGLFRYLWDAYIIRNQIRSNMANGQDPVIDWKLLHATTNIDCGIRKWTPHGPDTEGSSRKVLSLLYKQMIRIYLWRTVYPPRVPTWQVHPKITEAVDVGIILLARIPPRDRLQAMLLAPAFIIGCAAFNTAQRLPVRKSIETIKTYTESRNADRAVEVLEEVWRRMDDKDERSWDWERTAHELGMDFLVN